MLTALKTNLKQKSKPTERTAKDITQILGYAATNPDYFVRYKSSDMVLHVHSDTYYLSEQKS